MNYLDIVIAVVLFLFGFRGFRKGLIIEIVTLLALGVGIYGAMHFSDFTAGRLQEVMNINPKYLNTIAFVLTFILLAVVVNLVGRVVRKMVCSMNLGFVDRLGGFLVGAAKGLLLCSTFVLVLNNLQFIGIIKEEVKEKSYLYPYVEKTVPYLYQGFDLVKGAIHDFNESTTPATDSIVPVQDSLAPRQDSIALDLGSTVLVAL